MSFVKKKDKLQSHKKLIKNCSFCGENHVKGKCLAYGKKCGNCGRDNHVASVCRQDKKSKGTPWKSKAKASHKVHAIEEATLDETDSESEESIYAVSVKGTRNQFFTNIEVQELNSSVKSSCMFQIDTGATCSVLTLGEYKKITDAPLTPSSTRLKLYDNSSIKSLGTVKLRCGINGITKKVNFQVVDGAIGLLLRSL